MKTTSFVLGLIFGMLCLTASMAMFIGAIFTEEAEVSIFGLAPVVACGFSLYHVFKMRESNGATSGVILIISSIVSGFMPVGIMITTLLGNSLTGAELLLYILAGLSAVGLLAVGIMAIALRKSTYRYALVLPQLTRSGITSTGMILAFLGGTANAIMGVVVFIQYFNDFKEVSYFYDISPMLILIILMILTLFAAFASLKNRLNAGILLTTFGGMLSLLMLIPTSFGLGSGEAFGLVVVLVELIVVAAGVLFLVSFKRECKQFESAVRKQAHETSAIDV